MYAMPITDWPENERPREKLSLFGPESLTAAELIAILISTGSGKLSALDLGKNLLRTFGSLETLASASITELLKIRGIGPAKAITLKAAFQLSRNLDQEIAQKKLHYVREPSDVANIFIPELGHLKQEVFAIALLDSAGKYLLNEKITIGTLNASLVHPREVYKAAIKHSAASIILVHNHPSGQLKPSGDDLKITQQLVDTGRILDIPVQDHIIIADKKYISLRELGYIS
jgi:DNA repair protein RadC